MVQAGGAWAELCGAATDRVRAHEITPDARRALREQFYTEHGGSRVGRFGYGTAEIAFLQWEIDRGVLNGLDHPERPGSPWWRAVNHHFNAVSELASLGWRQGLEPEAAPEPVALWLRYMASPGRRSWYRAHTRAIRDGVRAARPLLTAEPPAEQAFIARVLWRLERAHGLCMAPRPVGLLADPRLGAVDWLIRSPLYPRVYPHPGRRAVLRTSVR